jgi:O-antigen/teichoic acid export membrane protein
MELRVARRRSITIGATYLAILVGVVTTLGAAKQLGVGGFGTFALVLAATALVQTFLDLTIEGTLVKYGCRYSERGDWGRLRRLFRRAVQIKFAGAAMAAACLAGAAFLAPLFVHAPALTTLLLLAAVIPLVQAPESVAAAALYVRGRHDVRALLLALGAALRFVGVIGGSSAGVAGALVGLSLAQVATTVVAGLAGRRALRTLPETEERDLGEDAREVTAFTVHSTVTTAVLSLRAAVMPLFLGTPAQVGLFRAAQAAEQGFEALAMPARMVLLSEQSHQWEAGAREAVLRSVARYTLWTTGAMLAVVPVLFVLAPMLVRVAYGEEFGAATSVLRLFIVAAAIQFVFSWTHPFAVAAGRPRLHLLVRSLEAVVLLALGALLARSGGAAGAAAAVAVSSACYGACWMTIYFRFRARERADSVVRAAPLRPRFA